MTRTATTWATCSTPLTTTRGTSRFCGRSMHCRTMRSSVSRKSCCRATAWCWSTPAAQETTASTVSAWLPSSEVMSATVAVQAKRREPSARVGRDAVALLQRDASNAGAERAIMVTSGKFTRGAQRAARETTPTVHLIDGPELCDLMHKRQIGVIVDAPTRSRILRRVREPRTALKAEPSRRHQPAGEQTLASSLPPPEMPHDREQDWRQAGLAPCGVVDASSGTVSRRVCRQFADQRLC